MKIILPYGIYHDYTGESVTCGADAGVSLAGSQPIINDNPATISFRVITGNKYMTGITIYTDGGCIRNPGPGGWGVRIEYSDGGVVEFGGRVSNTTNNRMEILAAAQALAATLDEDGPLTLFTDSQYLKKGITAWIQNWKANGWRLKSRSKTAVGEPVKNQDIWKLLDLLNTDRVQWKWVKGHAKNPGNMRVDEIANGFANGRAPVLEIVPGKPIKKARRSKKTVSPPALSDGGLFDAPSSGKDIAYPCYVSLVSGELAVHATWGECQNTVHGVSGAKFKKCKTSAELKACLDKWGIRSDTLDGR